MGVLEATRNQPEFNIQPWQYLNRVTPADGYAGVGLLARLRQGS
jgi:hypothetical protein